MALSSHANAASPTSTYLCTGCRAQRKKQRRSNGSCRIPNHLHRWNVFVWGQIYHYKFGVAVAIVCGRFEEIHWTSGTRMIRTHFSVERWIDTYITDSQLATNQIANGRIYIKHSMLAFDWNEIERKVDTMWLKHEIYQMNCNQQPADTCS